MSLEDVEKEHIRRTLEHLEWNKSQAAAILNIERSTLDRKIKLYGLNSVGLQRNNFPEEVVRELKRAYRLFFRSELNVTQAKERASTELKPFPEVQELLRFVEESGRGVVV